MDSHDDTWSDGSSEPRPRAADDSRPDDSHHSHSDHEHDHAGHGERARPEGELGFLGKAFFPAIGTGLKNTFRHMVASPPNTINYPDEKRAPRVGYRGEHRLIKDEQGRENCVACFMCATACPAHCIEIVAEKAPWPDRDKRPKIFNIDLLRCIYCGMCEWACPCNAIELTDVFNIPARTRSEKIYDKERLLSN